MVTLLLTFLIAMTVSTLLTIIVRNTALERGWVDRGSTRKVHTRPVPRLGGIAIAIGFFTPLAALLVARSGVGELFRANQDLVLGLFLGGGAIALLGLYDDFKGAGAKLKFSAQLAVAGALWFLGFRIEVIANPFGPELALGALAFPFTALWIVGLINAMNLIDGLDGLAGGVAFFGLSTNLLLALSRGDILFALVLAALCGAVLGFLIFNFNPASIFMGDTGSMFLGAILAAASIKTSMKSGTVVTMIVPVIALGLPIMDTLLAMIRRTALGRPMFSADKEHIHHRLMSRLRLSHRGAVISLYALSCLFCGTALALNHANSGQSAMILVALGVVVAVLMRKLGYFSLREIGQVRRRNVQLRTLVKDVNGAIRGATSPQDLWTAIRPLSFALDASRIELRFDGELFDEAIVFQSERTPRAMFPFTSRFELGAGDASLGALLISWSDGRQQIDRDEELALEMVADALSKAARRMTERAGADPLKVVALR